MPTRVFIANVDHVLADGPISGKLAQKVMQVSPRFAHYPFDVIVVPGQVPPAFNDYVTSFGHNPVVYTPTGLDPNHLSILDAFSDPVLLGLLNGAEVSSYLRTPELFKAVTAAGGHYVGGDPTPYADLANSKANYIQMAQGAVATPPNCAVVRGLSFIAREVYDRLIQGRDVFVRLDLSGGGFGNRVFIATEWGVPSMRSIIQTLQGSDPESWMDGVALIEDRIDLAFSPGVAFHTDHGTLYDFLQITRKGKDNVGRWTPVPPWICSGQELDRIGAHFAAQLRQIGFHGDADTDLGIGSDGTRFGFEINGRFTGSRETIETGQRLFGPWSTWRSQGVAVKSITDYHLRSAMSFEQLFATLTSRGLLATPASPCGVVILVPPVGSVAGIAAFGSGYMDAERIFREVDDLVGNPDLNTEDAPLFAATAA